MRSGRGETHAALDRILDAQEKLDQARAELDEAILTARSVGVTWQRIGQGLGVSRQAVHSRFAVK